MNVHETEATGRTLGDRYWIETIVGQGGMATVYRARDELLGRSVALKLFRENAVDSSRQEAELAVLASLNHHSLVSLFDAGVEQGLDGQAHRYLVMELVEGSDLKLRLAQGVITPRHIAEIGYDLAEALDYVHAKGVIHRDIKPSNILLVDYGAEAPRARAKLTDFGIAISDDVERQTRDGATTGTAAYLSPEQAAGASVGPASDVYSLGLVLLECFTRTIEYPGTIVESAVARLSRNPAIPEHLPDHWRALLAAMTARKPSDRPSRRELVATLRQLVIAESARHKVVDEQLFPSDEAVRADALRSAYMDTFPDAALDRVTAMAARLFSAPISVVSVVDKDRIWLKSHFGAEVERIVREIDLSSATAPQSETLVIEDASIDPRTSGNPLVTGPLALRFYAGVPLTRNDGVTIGTLCVMDSRTHTVSQAEIANLEDLGALVMAQLDLRRESVRITGEIPGEAPMGKTRAI